MLVVEPVRNADVSPVTRLALDTLRERYDPQWLAAHAAVGTGPFLVARDVPTNQIVGFALAEKDDASRGHLLALAVDTTRRGEGIGRALLGEVRQRLAKSGAMQMVLDVRADDRVAQEFYYRQGFTPDGLDENVYSDGGDAVRMVRSL